MRITDLPSELRPRERLLAKGAGALTDAELLAVLLRTGTGGVSAIELGQSLLNHFGSLPRLLCAAPHDLSPIRGLGQAKGAVILAVTELQRRALHQLASEETVLDSPYNVRLFLQHRFAGLQEERFLGLFTDMRYRLLAVDELATGTLGRVNVYPREVVRLALKHNAAAVIFAHNHPGGSPEPSEMDKALTRKLKQVMAAIEVRLLDHLIVTPQEIWSFSENGLC